MPVALNPTNLAQQTLLQRAAQYEGKRGTQDRASEKFYQSLASALKANTEEDLKNSVDEANKAYEQIKKMIERERTANNLQKASQDLCVKNLPTWYDYWLMELLAEKPSLRSSLVCDMTRTIYHVQAGLSQHMSSDEAMRITIDLTDAFQAIDQTEREQGQVLDLGPALTAQQRQDERIQFRKRYVDWCKNISPNSITTP